MSGTGKQAQSTGEITRSQGSFAYGIPTAAGDVPITGSASYAAEIRATLNPGTTGAYWVTGSANLLFDFAGGTLSGSMIRKSSTASTEFPSTSASIISRRPSIRPAAPRFRAGSSSRDFQARTRFRRPFTGRSRGRADGNPASPRRGRSPRNDRRHLDRQKVLLSAHRRELGRRIPKGFQQTIIVVRRDAKLALEK